MAESAYFRSPSRRELRDRRNARKEMRDNQRQVHSALNSLLRTDREPTVYEEPEVKLTTEIPSEFLPQPKKGKGPKATSSSFIARDATNPTYEEQLKTRPQTAEPKPVVDPQRKFALSWEARGAKNDTTTVQSKLTFTRSASAEGPAALYKIPPAQNPRLKLQETNKARAALKVKAPEKKIEPFKYQPSITKIDGIPRVASIEAPRPKSAKVELGDRARVGTKPFR